MELTQKVAGLPKKSGLKALTLQISLLVVSAHSLLLSPTLSSSMTNSHQCLELELQFTVIEFGTLRTLETATQSLAKREPLTSLDGTMCTMPLHAQKDASKKVKVSPRMSPKLSQSHQRTGLPCAQPPSWDRVKTHKSSFSVPLTDLQLHP